MTSEKNPIDSFLTNVKLTMERNRMTNPGDTVLAAISGGADSVALLCALSRLREELSFSLEAVHVNHGIRGEDADRDEQFCTALCNSLHVHLRVFHKDVPALARERGLSEETCGREVRYTCFEEAATAIGGPVKIATAHQANDSVETMLFHLARGTGLHGLTGIPAVRGRIIRPLIDCTREEIEVYLNSIAQNFQEDFTNADVTYARNRIRYHILPEFQKINSAAVSNMYRTMKLLQEDALYLDESAAELAACVKADKFRVEVLREAPKPLVMRALSQLIEEVTGACPEQVHLELLFALLQGEEGGTVQVPGGASVTVRDGTIRFSVAEEKKELHTFAPFEVQGAPETVFPGGTFRYRVVENTYGDSLKLPAQKEIFQMMLDYDKIKGDFLLRNRRAGDRIRLPFRKVSKSLKSLYSELGIPKEQRDRNLLLVKNGTLCWGEDIGPAEDFTVTNETEHIMLIEVERSMGEFANG